MGMAVTPLAVALYVPRPVASARCGGAMAVGEAGALPVCAGLGGCDAAPGVRGVGRWCSFRLVSPLIAESGFGVNKIIHETSHPKVGGGSARIRGGLFEWECPLRLLGRPYSGFRGWRVGWGLNIDETPVRRFGLARPIDGRGLFSGGMRLLGKQSAGTPSRERPARLRERSRKRDRVLSWRENFTLRRTSQIARNGYGTGTKS